MHNIFLHTKINIQTLAHACVRTHTIAGYTYILAYYKKSYRDYTERFKNTSAINGGKDKVISGHFNIVNSNNVQIK